MGAAEREEVRVLLATLEADNDRDPLPERRGDGELDGNCVCDVAVEAVGPMVRVASCVPSIDKSAVSDTSGVAVCVTESEDEGATDCVCDKADEAVSRMDCVASRVPPNEYGADSDTNGVVVCVA